MPVDQSRLPGDKYPNGYILNQEEIVTLIVDITKGLQRPVDWLLDVKPADRKPDVLPGFVTSIEDEFVVLAAYKRYLPDMPYQRLYQQLEMVLDHLRKVQEDIGWDRSDGSADVVEDPSWKRGEFYDPPRPRASNSRTRMPSGLVAVNQTLEGLVARGFSQEEIAVLMKTTVANVRQQMKDQGLSKSTFAP